MGSIGLAEILLILFIFLLLFGAARLPALAKGLGLAVRKFQGAAQQDDEEEDSTGRSGS